MRPTRHHKKTHRGLGSDNESPEDEATPPAPPSTRGVNAVPPSEPSPGRYSVRPARHETREFASPVGPPSSSRRPTVRMPSYVDEAERAGPLLVIDDRVTPKPLPHDGKLQRAPLGSREAFVLSLVDGRSRVASLVDAAGMSRSELVTILGRLADLELISL